MEGIKVIEIQVTQVVFCSIQPIGHKHLNTS